MDAEFRVYLVASVNEFGELTVADTFEQFNIDLQGGNDRRRLGSDAVYLHDRRKEMDHSPLHADGRIKMQTPTPLWSVGVFPCRWFGEQLPVFLRRIDVAQLPMVRREKNGNAA